MSIVDECDAMKVYHDLKVYYFTTEMVRKEMHL